MQTVLSLTPKQALEYFMDAEQYCGIALPSYINFQPILDYVKTTIGAKELAIALKKKSNIHRNSTKLIIKYWLIKMENMLTDLFK